MALLKIVAVSGPNIVQAVYHTISEQFADAPMSELVEKIRDINSRNEEQEEPHVYRRPGIL
jgi:hypothetical protein